MLRRVYHRLSIIAVTPCALTVLAMIASLFLAQFGYPVWEATAKQGDEPYPCQHRRCGCRTAEQCRQSCCCHTKQQKIAWAVARGLDPGRYVDLFPADKLTLVMASVDLIGNRTCKDGICAERATKSCCSPKPACCQSKAQTNDQKVRWVLAFVAQKCSGTGVEWIQAGFVGTPPLKVTLTIIPQEESVVSEQLVKFFSPVQEPLLRPV